jgi:hypothetical protein
MRQRSLLRRSPTASCVCGQATGHAPPASSPGTLNREIATHERNRMPADDPLTDLGEELKTA